MEYKEINNLLVKTSIELRNSNKINESFRATLINAEKALRELKRFY